MKLICYNILLSGPLHKCAATAGMKACDKLTDVGVGTILLVVHMCLLFIRDTAAYLREVSRCIHWLEIHTRSHGVVTTVPLRVADGAGLTLFKTQGHSITHEGQLVQFISLLSDWNKLFSHPLLPTSYLPGQGWREEAVCPGFGQDRANFHQKPGEDTSVWTDPNWPNKTGYSIPCAVMLGSGWGTGQRKINWGSGVRRAPDSESCSEHFAICFVYFSYQNNILSSYCCYCSLC